jgi:molybdopterin biosynthesis enzyme
VGLTELVLLRETKGGLEPVSAGSITLSALARAEGFLVLPPDSEGLPDGAEVEAYAV